jgi:hypothetical protein
MAIYVRIYNKIKNTHTPGWRWKSEEERHKTSLLPGPGLKALLYCVEVEATASRPGEA